MDELRRILIGDILEFKVYREVDLILLPSHELMKLLQVLLNNKWM